MNRFHLMANVLHFQTYVDENLCDCDKFSDLKRLYSQFISLLNSASFTLIEIHLGIACLYRSQKSRWKASWRSKSKRKNSYSNIMRLEIRTGHSNLWSSTAERVVWIIGTSQCSSSWKYLEPSLTLRLKLPLSFMGASSLAFSTCVHVHTNYLDRLVLCHLLPSKSRVAPLKVISINSDPNFVADSRINS